MGSEGKVSVKSKPLHLEALLILPKLNGPHSSVLSKNMCKLYNLYFAFSLLMNSNQPHKSKHVHKTDDFNELPPRNLHKRQSL